MQVELRKIRTFPNENELPFQPRILADSVKSVLANPQFYLSQIHETERYNCFITLGKAKFEDMNDPTRKWESQECLIFDIDHVSDSGIIPHGDIPAFKKAFIDALQVREENFSMIWSGHGLHILLFTTEKIASKKFFDKFSLHYQALTSRLLSRLAEAKLPGGLDTAVFKPNVMTRLPGTLNKKEGLETSEVVLLWNGTTPIDKTLAEMAGMDVFRNDYATDIKTAQKTDNKTILDECTFLRHCKDNAASITEPQWQKMITVTSFMSDGEKLTHELSNPHPGYREDQTLQKIRNALNLSGPATCRGIEKNWEGCRDCKWYGKITTPLQIKSESFLSTEDTFFHATVPSANGRPKKVAQYTELVQAYKNDHAFLNVDETREHYIFDGKVWLPQADIRIQNFAMQKFGVLHDAQKVAEFLKHVKFHEPRHHSFFSDSVAGKLNLQNGVLNIETGELEPHTPKYGFRTVLPYNYEAGAKCPDFETLLHNVTEGNEIKKRTLLQYFGYTLAAGVPFAEKMLILTGEGSNGKSQTIDVLTNLIGYDAMAKFSLENCKNEFYQVSLDGARMALFEEIPRSQDKAVWELLKDWSAGGTVSASRKFQNAIKFKNRAKIVITCNALPYGTDPSHGYFRRLLIVPFTATFSRSAGNLDIGLKDRVVREELPGVLNLVLKAYRELQEQNYKFSVSADSVDALEAYKKEVNNVHRFIDDEFEAGEPNENYVGNHKLIIKTPQGVGIDYKNLYVAYTEYAENEGERACAQKEFNHRLLATMAIKVGHGAKVFKDKDGFWSVGSFSKVRSRTETSKVTIVLGLRPRD